MKRFMKLLLTTLIIFSLTQCCEIDKKYHEYFECNNHTHETDPTMASLALVCDNTIANTRGVNPDYWFPTFVGTDGVQIWVVRYDVEHLSGCDVPLSSAKIIGLTDIPEVDAPQIVYPTTVNDGKLPGFLYYNKTNYLSCDEFSVYDNDQVHVEFHGIFLDVFALSAGESSFKFIECTDPLFVDTGQPIYITFD